MTGLSETDRAGNVVVNSTFIYTDGGGMGSSAVPIVNGDKGQRRRVDNMFVANAMKRGGNECSQKGEEVQYGGVPRNCTPRREMPQESPLLRCVAAQLRSRGFV